MRWRLLRFARNDRTQIRFGAKSGRTFRRGADLPLPGGAGALSAGAVICHCEEGRALFPPRRRTSRPRNPHLPRRASEIASAPRAGASQGLRSTNCAKGLDNRTPFLLPWSCRGVGSSTVAALPESSGGSCYTKPPVSPGPHPLHQAAPQLSGRCAVPQRKKDPAQNNYRNRDRRTSSTAIQHACKDNVAGDH